ncbi:ribonuclease H-like protein [Wilcoxina mikolae CBS 423.85]|nr:ribonuclease H-like protein [Wilcoxina mikolae CBS 423.85]
MKNADKNHGRLNELSDDTNSLIQDTTTPPILPSCRPVFTFDQQPSASITKSSASLAVWAKDNNIPAVNIGRAHDNISSIMFNLPASNLTTKASSAAILSSTIADCTFQPDTAEAGKYIAMDCEMVGIGEGDNESSALARVSIVNFHGSCVLDCFVKPKEDVTDWRTWVSGVSPQDMVHALGFEEVQKKVAELMNGRILIGHGIKNDLDCLLIGHPKRDIRDTSRHPQFRKYSKGRTPALKKLANEILGIEIQSGSHSSIEDARACMLLYKRFKDDFERQNQIRFHTRGKMSRVGIKFK